MLATPEYVPCVKLHIVASAMEGVYKIERCLYPPSIYEAEGVMVKPSPYSRDGGGLVRATTG